MEDKNRVVVDVEPTDAERKAANLDPITDAPGAHPVGTAVGAAVGGMAGIAAGAAAGAATGTLLGGPIGTAAGLIIGAATGGLAGKSAAELIDPTEEAYWREHYRHEPYVQAGEPYDFYAPAYRTAFEARTEYKGQAYEDIEPQLQARYEQSRKADGLTWERAKDAVKAAWNRVVH